MIEAGVDEVGRGPLAGPVVAAAVILPPNFARIDELCDSKKLSASKIRNLSDEIRKHALCWSIAEASVAEIDQINILQASLLAMQRALESLEVVPDIALVDGNKCPQTNIATRAVIKGDATEPCISAASIIAKAHRDQLMSDYAITYPHYGFDQNAGYPTALHRQALLDYGITDIHRRSFKPVKAIIES